MRDGYQVRWSGQDYEASPDGADVRLYSADPTEGFDEVAPGRYRRIIALREVEDSWYERTVLTWRDQPFAVLDEQGDWLRVEYLGGRAPVAEDLGLERFDHGVYQGWAPRAEVSGVRVERI